MCLDEQRPLSPTRHQKIFLCRIDYQVNINSVEARTLGSRFDMPIPMLECFCANYGDWYSAQGGAGGT